MATYEFIIPLSLDALQESFSPNQYAVSYIYSTKEISPKLFECIQAYKKNGSQFILDANNFDLLYSLILKFPSLDEETTIKAWNFMIKAMAELTVKITTQFAKDSLEREERANWLLILKMTTYMSCLLMEAFEKNHCRPSIETLAVGKRGKKPSKRTDFGVDWEEERIRMLVQLYSILQGPISRLWDPPIIDEDYVNLIANSCYKMLETPSMNLVRTKPVRDSIFQIVGLLVKRHNHGLACFLKLMQLLQHFEHLVSPVAQGVILMMETYQVKSVLQDMIREVVKLDGRDLAKDSSGLRNYSLFLIEVSDQCPELFISSLPLLVSLLQHEAYSLRNCVLSILGSIVRGVLKGETLDQKGRNLRNECLEYLEDFIHDCHAFVRSKVLQIWQELVNAQSVPLAQQSSVLKKVVNRLRDKSSNVRKYALHLLCAFLKGNPFAAKLPLEELQSQFDAEMKNLEELSPGITLDDNQVLQDDGMDALQENWIILVPCVVKSLKKLIKGITDDTDSEPENSDSEMVSLLPRDVTLNSGMELIGEALLDSNVNKAIQLLKEVMENFTGAEVLRLNEDEDASQEKSIELFQELSEDQRQYFILLHRIFVSFMRLKQIEKEDEISDTQKKQINDEILKQKLYCCYLRDSIFFAKELHRGLPDICQMLNSKHISDVLEAVKFLVSAFEFGLENAITGVRRMLMLIWSKEATIKEAVVEAYKHLYINIEAPNSRSRAQHIVRNLTALSNGANLAELTSLEELVSTFMASGDIDKHCITLMWERFTKAIPDISDDEAKSSLSLLMMAAKSEATIISSNINVLVQAGLKSEPVDFTMIKIVCQALAKIGNIKPKSDDPNPPDRLDKDHEIFGLMSDILTKGLSNMDSNQYCPMANEAITMIYMVAENPDIICGEMIKNMAKQFMEYKVSDMEEDSQIPEGEVRMSNIVLSRFLFICGHIASRQLVHLDTYVFSELKRRNLLREELHEKKTKRVSRRKEATSASAIKTYMDTDIDEEMGVTGALADDAEADFIRNVCEKEIVSGDALLAEIRPFIIAVCSNPTKYTDATVRTSACLALAKFMMVSTECCQQNLQLLFTILEKSSEPILRANTIIAIGDLTFRFPNLVEPWTPKIYGRLRDDSILVRRNTLTILTQLILNDQVKVKGQISDIASCINDEDSRLAGLSKLFFNELSKKGNSLYNVLPDIISRLADTEIGIGEVSFRTIMSYIFGLVQKDKQLEAFVEKLCHRLQATNNPRQWRDLTYCLSLLSYTEKAVRKLTENFGCYADKLYEADVHELFGVMLANARKQSKAECKTAIDELESKIEEAYKKGVEGENVVNKANRVKKIKQNRAKVRPQKIESGSDEEYDLHPVHRMSKENVPPRRSSARQSQNRSISTESSNSSDEENAVAKESEENTFKAPLSVRSTRMRRVRK